MDCIEAGAGAGVVVVDLEAGDAADCDDRFLCCAADCAWGVPRCGGGMGI